MLKLCQNPNGTLGHFNLLFYLKAVSPVSPPTHSEATQFQGAGWYSLPIDAKSLPIDAKRDQIQG